MDKSCFIWLFLGLECFLIGLWICLLGWFPSLLVSMTLWFTSERSFFPIISLDHLLSDIIECIILGTQDGLLGCFLGTKDIRPEDIVWIWIILGQTRDSFSITTFQNLCGFFIYWNSVNYIWEITSTDVMKTCFSF